MPVACAAGVQSLLVISLPTMLALTGLGVGTLSPVLGIAALFAASHGLSAASNGGRLLIPLVARVLVSMGRRRSAAWAILSPGRADVRITGSPKNHASCGDPLCPFFKTS